MNRDNTEKSKQTVSPAFNSSLDYLDRIGGLIRSFEMGIIDTKIEIDTWYSLDMLRAELIPRMNKSEKEECLKVRKLSRGLKYNSLVEYFIFLNSFAHKKGLIMKDNIFDSEMPDAVRNMGGRR